MNKINFVSAHVVSEVIEDSLDLLIMWCDERYTYDDRPYEQPPIDEVAVKYLATIACCLQVAVNAHDYRTLCNRYAQGLVEEYQHELDNTKEEIEMTQELDRFVCDSCGEVSVLPSYDPMFGRGQVCFRCHEANNKIERMLDMDTRLKEDYEDEVEYQHELDRFTAELEEDEMDEKRFHLDNTKEEIEMTNEVKKYQTMCRNCGEVFDVWVSDEDLNKPQFHICEDCVAEEEIEMMNEEDCMAEEERFPAGENHIDECHHCGLVFEVQDLIPVERYRGFGGDNHNIVVFLCEACFEEEYHTVLE